MCRTWIQGKEHSSLVNQGKEHSSLVNVEQSNIKTKKIKQGKQGLYYKTAVYLPKFSIINC